MFFVMFRSVLLSIMGDIEWKYFVGPCIVIHVTLTLDLGLLCILFSLCLVFKAPVLGYSFRIFFS